MSSIGEITQAAGYQPVNTTGNTSSKKADSSKKSEVKKEDAAAVYEKSSSSDSKKATYSINKMSEQDRAALVSQLKADQESRQNQLMDLVHKMMTGQGKAYSLATGDDSIWKFLSSGDFTVDAATKAQAQEDISENGYWGVDQVSQRLFDFASALAGDDVEKMEKMQAAMEKGYKMAVGAWGKDLPEISEKTMAAANKLFEDYYASKKEAE